MANQIHGHEVLHLMLDSGKDFTRQELVHEIIARFGAEARFHTCSAENLSAEQLVDFLQARGKFVERGGRFNTAPEFICRH